MATNGVPPQFAAGFEATSQVNEGDDIEICSQYLPLDDNSVQLEWYKDGVLLSSGSRFAIELERGYLSLIISDSIAQDAGQYVAVLHSNSGSVQSDPVQIHVHAEALHHHENDEMIRETRQLAMNEAAPDADDHQHRFDAPQITKQLEVGEGGGEVAQGDAVRILGQVEPRGDDSLRVEWVKDGRPVTTGSRFTIVQDRGFCVLDIHHAYPEDSGMYSVLATNAAGQVQSNVVEIVCHPDAAIETRSCLTDESIQRIKTLDFSNGGEENGQMAGSAGTHVRHDYSHLEEENSEEAAPQFDVAPVNVATYEGGPAKFLVRISGHPRPQVSWTLNGEPVESSSTVKIYGDGPINYLEFDRCGEVGDFEVRVQANNSLGNVDATVVLRVAPVRLDAPDLRHVNPHRGHTKKLQALRKVECSAELNTALAKPKPSAQNIVLMERESEKKGRHVKTQDIHDTEKMYDKVATGLKKSGHTMFDGTLRKSSLSNSHHHHHAPPPKQHDHTHGHHEETGAEFSIQL